MARRFPLPPVRGKHRFDTSRQPQDFRSGQGRDPRGSHIYPCADAHGSFFAWHLFRPTAAATVKATFAIATDHSIRPAIRPSPAMPSRFSVLDWVRSSLRAKNLYKFPLVTAEYPIVLAFESRASASFASPAIGSGETRSSIQASAQLAHQLAGALVQHSRLVAAAQESHSPLAPELRLRD
jgi:hypothetical protein